MNHRGIVVGALLMAATASSQADISYEYVGFGSALNTPVFTRFSGGIGDPAGGIFFTCNGTDRLGYITDPLALIGVTTAEDTNAIATLVTDQEGFATGSSWQDLAYVNGYYFATGRQNTVPPFTQILRARITSAGTPAGPLDWEIVSYFPDGSYSGVVAFTENLIAMSVFETGALQFFDLTSGSAVPVGSPITGSGLYTPSLDYDPVGGRIFAYSVQPVGTEAPFAAHNGGVSVFSTNGTAGGTTYLGSNPYLPVVPSSFTMNQTASPPTFDFQVYYGKLAVHPTKQYLLRGFSTGTVDAIGAVWTLFDISGATPSLLFETNGSDVTPELGNGIAAATGTFGTARRTMTTTFFSKGGEDYIALAPNNGIMYFYKEVDSDLAVVVPTITLLNANPNALTAVSFGVNFDKSVPAFGASNVALTGTLGGNIFIGGSDPNYIVLVDTSEDDANGTLGIELLPNFNDGTGVAYDGNNGVSALYTINAGGGGGVFDGDYNNDGLVNAADVTAFAQDIVNGVWD